MFYFITCIWRYKEESNRKYKYKKFRIERLYNRVCIDESRVGITDIKLSI